MNFRHTGLTQSSWQMSFHPLLDPSNSLLIIRLDFQSNHRHHPYLPSFTKVLTQLDKHQCRWYLLVVYLPRVAAIHCPLLRLTFQWQHMPHFNNNINTLLQAKLQYLCTVQQLPITHQMYLPHPIQYLRYQWMFRWVLQILLPHRLQNPLKEHHRQLLLNQIRQICWFTEDRLVLPVLHFIPRITTFININRKVLRLKKYVERFIILIFVEDVSQSLVFWKLQLCKCLVGYFLLQHDILS